MGRLNNKNVIITGAAGGMGLATANVFIAEGARVMLTDINSSPLKQLSDKFGGNVIHATHDVTRMDEWRKVIDTTNDCFGSVDVLINNAGILRFSTIVDMSEDEFDLVMNINMRGVFLGTQQVALSMIRQGYGSIINISSTGAMCPTNATSAYAASKAAVHSFTDCSALELGPHGIRVNAIHPGGINTPMTNPENDDDTGVNSKYADIPLQRAGSADEVAKASLYFASDESSYCTGSHLVVDGGSLAGRYYPFLPGAPENLQQ